MKTNVKPKISIIIPVYNIEEYLSRCLDSVLAQTLEEIEVIVINDGSTDNADAVITEYAGRDARIRYVSQENTGLGLTRNIGISMAVGEYIGFVDSDDYIEPDMYEKLFEKAISGDFDIVVSEALIEFGDRSYIDVTLEGTEDIKVDDNTISKYINGYFYRGKVRGWAWNKIYRTEFIKSNEIVFGDNKYVYTEDLYFMFHCMINGPSIGFVPKAFYHYVQRPGSLVNSNKETYFKKHLWLINHFFEYSSNEYLEAMICSMIFRGILNDVRYAASSGKSFTWFRNNMKLLYDNPAYERFMAVNKESGGRAISSFRRKKILATVFCFFQRMGMKRASEFFLYYSRKLQDMVKK